jgi:hypothetical protein
MENETQTLIGRMFEGKQNGIEAQIKVTGLEEGIFGKRVLGNIYVFDFKNHIEGLPYHAENVRLVDEMVFEVVKGKDLIDKNIMEALKMPKVSKWDLQAMIDSVRSGTEFPEYAYISAGRLIKGICDNIYKELKKTKTSPSPHDLDYRKVGDSK